MAPPCVGCLFEIEVATAEDGYKLKAMEDQLRRLLHGDDPTIAVEAVRLGARGGALE